MKVIQDIHNSYFLVNIVDNAFTNEESDIFAIFKGIISSSMSKDELKERCNELDLENKRLRDNVDKLNGILLETSKDLKSLHDRLAKEKALNANLKLELRTNQGFKLVSNC